MILEPDCAILNGLMARPKKKDVSVGDFCVSLVFSDHTELRKGASILDCLNQLAEGGFYKGKCILRVEHEGKTAEKVWYPYRLRRLVANLTLRRLTERLMLSRLK